MKGFFRLGGGKFLFTNANYQKIKTYLVLSTISLESHE